MKESKEKGEGIGAKGEFVVGTREGLFWLKEWEMTEERGGGMGRSDKGFCGPESVGFPAEVKEEETKEVPGKGN